MITQTLEVRYQDEDFWTAKLQLELFRLIRNYLAETGLSQNQFAANIGVSKSYMSQVLNGNFDHKLSKLVSLALAIGKIPHIEYEDFDSVVRRAKGEYEPLKLVFESKPQRVTLPDDGEEQSNLFAGSDSKASVPASIIFNEVA